MFDFNRPLELPPQLQWKFSHEPECLGWTIQARNYNTFVANCMFAFMSVLILWWTYFLHPTSRPNESVLTAYLVSLCFYMVCLLAISSMTHQRMNFAYRFTKSGVECCEWKDFPRWALVVLKWLAGITAVIFIFLATIDPYFLLGALIGPGGLGLTYLSIAYSKGYREMHTQYHHLIYEWKDFTQLAIATNRGVVDLKFIHFDQRLGRIVNWNLNIFCKRKQKEKVAEFIKPYLSSGVPSIRAKVNVPLSTD